MKSIRTLMRSQNLVIEHSTDAPDMAYDGTENVAEPSYTKVSDKKSEGEVTMEEISIMKKLLAQKMDHATASSSESMHTVVKKQLEKNSQEAIKLEGESIKDSQKR